MPVTRGPGPWRVGRQSRLGALRVVFINVPKPNLPTNKGLDALLGPFLGGPDRGLRLI
jgi:hypothetical protein